MAVCGIVNVTVNIIVRKYTVAISRSAFLKPSFVSLMESRKYFSVHRVTPNLLLNCAGPVKIVSDGNVPKVSLERTQPLVVLLEYMNAKDKHVKKFVDYYAGYGFDVLRIHLKPWQLLWPTKGSQMVAKDTAEFLLKNHIFSPLILHGFSVGGYLWGEVLVHMSQNKEKYQEVADRIQAQIFDSGVDVTEIPVGFPAAVFPNNAMLKSTFEKYIRYHMRTFFDESTRHYIASRASFTAGLAKAPTLFIFSDGDPLSTPVTNGAAIKELAALGLEGHGKCFKGSKHVMHFQKFKDEYLAEVDDFLTKANVLQPLQLKAKL